MLLFIYTLLIYILSPLFIIRLLWKSRSLPDYRKRIAERFTIVKKEAKPIDIWVHAVSLGEVIAVTPLIKQLLRQEISILVTTMTPTGSQQVIKTFKGEVVHQYLPYDLPFLFRRFLKRYAPKLVLIMETELWPNMIEQISKHNIPMILINARLSEKSLQGYSKLKFFFKPLLNKFNEIITQGEDDKTRFTKLGVDESKLFVSGNMKFDQMTQSKLNNDIQEVRNLWGEKRLIVLAASTHKDEEKQILTHWSTLKNKCSQAILLIAPRHPERFKEVYQLSKAQGFNTGYRTDSSSLAPNNDVIVIDTLGELVSWYDVSDFAFVGGSLVTGIGGHNILEPIATRTAVIVGPHNDNFKGIIRIMKQEKAIAVVPNSQALIEKIIYLYENKFKKDELIKNASRIMQENQGAVAFCLKHISKYTNDNSLGK